MKKKRFLTIQTAFLCCLFNISCFASCSSQNTELTEKYGKDSDYFLALNCVKEKNKGKAEKLLKKAIKNGSPLISRKASEEYAQLATGNAKISRTKKTYEDFPDETSLLDYCRALEEAKDYTKIAEATEKINADTAENELAALKFRALMELKDSSFQEQFDHMLLSRPFTQSIYNTASKIKNPSVVVQLRKNVFEKKYDAAYKTAKEYVSSQDTASVSPQAASDIGKALIYGSTGTDEAVNFLDSLKDKCTDDALFYVYYYTGRVYAKNKNALSSSTLYFVKAMETAKNSELKDNALWYLLNTQMQSNLKSMPELLEKYGSEFSDRSYFDNFFDSLSVALLSAHAWEEYYAIEKQTETCASDEVAAKYAYVTARLIEENFLIPAGTSRDDTLNHLYNGALNSSTDMYYKLIAASRQNLMEDQVMKSLLVPNRHIPFSEDENLEKLLEGYVDFNLPEYIYGEWVKNPNGISMKCAEKISGFLNSCGTDTNDYASKSLRIAAKKLNYCETIPDMELLKLVYPQNFHEYVASSCSEYDLNENLLYALIRSESFFAPQVVSHAGAVGLTQLMNTTASDIAKKLKVSEFDLNDASTNIKFGAWYIKDMIKRLDGSSILALFAYNGGITRVRRWVKNANAEFGKDNLPKDLFLEVLPFAETREYGRKVSSAAAIYGLLYYDTSVKEVMEDVLR